jgi:hypothetical protein
VEDPAVDIVKELVGQLRYEVAEHRRPLIVVASAITVLVLAGIVAALVGSEIAVATIAGIGILGTAIAVLAVTAFLRI